MARLLWTEAARSVLHELDPDTRAEIARRVRLLRLFPLMYPASRRGRFPRHRRFLAGDWVVYYRVAGNTVYIRGLWPARLP